MFFFLSHGEPVSQFSHYSSLVARQISWGTSESAPLLNVNLWPVWFTLIGVSMVTVGQLGPSEREGQRRAAFHRASTQTEKHTNQITPKQDYNACESSLFTHIFTLLCIKKYI